MESEKYIEALGKIAEPVNTVVSKIANATGIIYEPTRMKRMAKAEAEAELLRLEILYGLTRSEAVSLKRMDLMKLCNFQSIIDKAIPLIDKELSTFQPDAVESDWLRLHYEKSSIVSDQEIQELWAKILAGEFNRPGSFSRQTLTIVEQMDKNIAKDFTKLGSCFFRFGGLLSAYFIENDETLQLLDVSFSSTVELENLGLIKKQGTIDSFNVGLHSYEPSISFEYFDIKGEVTLQPNGDTKNEYYLPVESIILTRAGRELGEICGALKNLEYYKFIQDQWANQTKRK